MERPDQDWDCLIDTSFLGVNRFFVLSFENKAQRISDKWHYLSTVEIKNYNVIIDGKSFFDQPVRNNLITYDTIQKIAIDQKDDYTTGCLLDYKYFEKYYTMMAIYLNNKHLMLIQKQYSNLILLEI